MGRITYVDYEKMRRRLEKLIKTTKSVKRKVEYQILLIQLVNGARISEAYDCYYQWVQNPSKREIYVVVKKKKNKVLRHMYVPELVEPINKTVHPNSIMRTCRRDLGVNTHSLRYAFITYMSVKHHLPFQLIAKITKHSKPELIEHYTHELIAKNIHRKMVLGDEK